MPLLFETISQLPKHLNTYLHHDKDMGYTDEDGEWFEDEPIPGDYDERMEDDPLGERQEEFCN